MNYTFPDILEIIPQRYPFVMIDSMVSVTPKKCISKFLIKEDNLFIHGGYFQPYGMIEGVAQTGAAGLNLQINGLMAKREEGFIAGISKLEVYSLPKVGDTITTEVTLIAQLNNMFKVQGVCVANNQTLLQCEVSIVSNS
jgi:3-hydroxymyristoyl/3-hydroxydecanoyl-(acyl carrier protein) dehydratase